MENHAKFLFSLTSFLSIYVITKVLFESLTLTTGMDNEGIFRISGNATTVRKIKEMMEKGIILRMSSLNCVNRRKVLLR